jgi:hypothetical protein
MYSCSGHLILVEGLSTGRARLTVSLAHSDYANVAPASIDLLITANLLLFPDDHVFVPPHARVQFSVKVVKMSTAIGLFRFSVSLLCHMYRFYNAI